MEEPPSELKLPIRRVEAQSEPLVLRREMKIEPQRIIKWEDWLAGRERRRAMSRLVAPLGARREESSADQRLRKEFGGERGPDLLGGAEG